MIPYHLLNPELSDEEVEAGMKEHLRAIRRMKLTLVIGLSISGVMILAALIYSMIKGGF